jgi:uncharacterized coiled-coil protein SlyX
MPTQEERLPTLEQTVNMHGKGIDDLNHNVTILLGITSEQGKDIRAMRVSLADLSQRLNAFEQRVDNRFEVLDSRIEVLEQSFNSRFEEQGKKLDQVLLLLNSVIPKPGQ